MAPAPPQKVDLFARAGRLDAPMLAPAEPRWGLIPSWAKDPAIGKQLINAQAETVATKPAFRKRRCLILAEGFYEWQRQDRRKQPYFIRLRDGRPLRVPLACR